MWGDRLALLYRAYERHMKAEAAVLSANRRRALRAAFALLVHDWQSAGAVDALSAEALPLSRFAPLLARLRPDLSTWQIGVIFEALDARKRGARLPYPHGTRTHTLPPRNPNTYPTPTVPEP